MKHNYVLIFDPEGSASVLGVFESGKKLADAAKALPPGVENECLVKRVPLNELSPNQLAGFDFVGTTLSEFLHCPVSQDDSGR
jgi:hypothetical protein